MRFRLTKTLLDAWYWSYRLDDGWDTFMKVLNREPIQPSVKMLQGTQFENCLNNVLDGNPISEDYEWYGVITQLADYLDGSQQQVVLTRGITVDGVDFLVHGVLDYLRAGVIYDLKFTKNYHLNKYLHSSQHPFYMYLVPEARRFEYCVSNGTDVFFEKYPRYIIPEAEDIIRDFMKFLDKQNLVDTYCDKWEVSKYDGKLV